MTAAATTQPLTAYRVHLSDGTSYVTSMAHGVTLEQAREYFAGYYDEEKPSVTCYRVTIAPSDGRTITRREYMDGDATHQDYYAQFVTDRTLAEVRSGIGEEAIKASNDPHMNDIPLARWGRLLVRDTIIAEQWKDAELTTYDQATQDRRPFMWSASSNVCIAKAAARIIKSH